MNAKSDWRHQAEVSFFSEGKTIVKTAQQLGVSARSVSAYLNSLPHYPAEVERRKEANRNRTDYYREHKRAKRKSLEVPITGESLRQEHETAVRILSREKFYNGY